MRDSINDLARGRWVEILSAVGGVPAHYLDNKHKPCPSCRDGEDRFRFDDIEGNGTWFCSHCGGRDGSGGGGTGMSLLMRVKDWDFKQAARAVEEHLGISKPVRRIVSQHPIKPPVDAEPPALDGASHQWLYTDAAGEPLFWIQRITKANGDKIFRHRTWIAGSGWQGAAGTSWPTPRPLYNLAALAARPNAQVIVCEGEKAANRAQELFPQLVAVTWPNGAQSVAKVDWSPLTGRSILLWPDNDDQGRDAMVKIARLIRDPAKLLTIDAPADAPEKWDIADAAWSTADALAYVKANKRPLDLPAVELIEITESPAKKQRNPRSSTALKDSPFRCLGFDRGIYFYLPQKAGQVTALTPAQHTKNYLLTLAPLKHWYDRFSTQNEKGQTLIDWTEAADTLISTCTSEGVYDPSRVRGRGAWSDALRVILHLGNRLVIDGKSSFITKLPEDFGSYYFYENAKPIEGPGSELLTDEIAAELKQIAKGFKWESEAFSNLLLGWIVLAPVCGALDWRPHIWITGPAGSGKTSLLKLFMKPLLGGMFEGATGGTTEAGLRGQLRSDAIPIVFDELEQNEQKDKQQVQNILSLARIASSEGGKIYKGTTNGGVNTFEIRSMFCVSSINVALIQRADLDRFCVLSLRKDQVPKDDWTAFETRIMKTCTDENGRKLVARTVQQIPAIRKNAKILAGALSTRFGQRFGDQYGTLLAGAWTLQPNGGGEISPEAARKWVDSMNWENGEVDANDADEMKCINRILQTILQLDGGRRIAVVELVQQAHAGRLHLTDNNGFSTDEIETVLGRYGLKVSGGCLAIANSSTNLQALLKDTPWAGNAYRQALRRLPQATVASGTIRFKGMGPSRATLVPLETLEIL